MKTLTPRSRKKHKHAAAWFMAVLMGLGVLPLRVLAETYQVSSDDELASSWQQANQNTDSSNTFNMTSGIDMSGQTLNTMAGKTYTINGNGNTLSNVDIHGIDNKTETVNINANISSTDSTALEVSGKVDVNVTGNVTTVSNSSRDANDEVIRAGKDADLSIKGNVTSEESGVHAHNAQKLVITGNVKLESENGVDPLNYALDINNTTTQITGNVISEEGGMIVSESSVTIGGKVVTDGESVIQKDSNVVIQGDFLSESGEGIGQFSGVYIAASDLTVKKNMEAPVVFAHGDSTIKVSKELDAVNVVLGANGPADDSTTLTAGSLDANFNAFGDTSATIKGNAEGSISVLDSASATVQGNATGAVDVVGAGAELTVQGNLTTSDPTTVMGGGSLTVNKNLTNTSTGTDSGVTVINNSDLYVGGTTTASQVAVVLDSKADMGNIASKSVHVGADSDLDDDSQLSCGDIKTGSNGNLYTFGNSHTLVRGSVRKNVYAHDNSVVNVYGTVNHASLYENGYVQTHLGAIWAGDPVVYYRPVDKTEDDELVALCKGYIMGSEMYTHASNLLSVMQSSRVEMDTHLGVGSALLTSVVEWPSVLKNKFFSAGLLTEADLKTYNSQSLSALTKTKKLNTYYVEMYKSHLAEALKELDTDNTPIADRGEIKKTADLVGKILDLQNGVKVSGLSKKAQDALKVLSKDKVITGKEALEFLTKYGGYSAGDEGLQAAARRMTDMYEFTKTMDAAGKTAKALLTAVDFAEYWGTSFEDHVVILDGMLDNQAMDPEMFVAVAELRKEYADKHYGLGKKAVELFRDMGIGYLVKQASNVTVLGGVNLAQMGIEVAAWATGIASDTEARNKGAALMDMLPQAYEHYEKAIKAVRDGDTSPQAVQLVQTSFSLLKCMMIEMTEANLELVPKKERAAYQDLLYDIQNLEPGEAISFG